MTAELDNSETAKVTSDQKRRKRRRWILLVFAFLILLFVPLVQETSFKCAICAQQRKEQRVVGILASRSERDTECSNWYRANVEPQHNHVWVRGPMAYGSTLYGLPIYMSQLSSRVNGPIFWLGSDRSKLVMYKKSPDPVLTRDLFLRLARYRPHGTEEYKQQTQLFQRIQDWMESGCEGPWPFETQ